MITIISKKFKLLLLILILFGLFLTILNIGLLNESESNENCLKYDADSIKTKEIYHGIYSDAFDVDVQGNIAYIAGEIFGFAVFNITDIKNPDLIGTAGTAGYALAVKAMGNCAYICEWDQGLTIMDVTDPTNPQFVKTIATPGWPTNLAIDGNFLYLADDTGGLQIFDITNPADPVKVSNCSIPGYASDVKIEGNYAFVTTLGEGLYVIDISDPLNPFNVSNAAETSAWAVSVDISGNHAYVADAVNGMSAYNITNPTNISFINSVYATGVDVAVSGNYAYMTDEFEDLLIINITDPTNPTILANYTLPGNAKSIEVIGEHAFIAMENFGLLIVEVTQLLPLEVVGNCSTNGWADIIVISGDYGYIADADGGFSVADVTDPENPIIVASLDNTSSGSVYAYDLIVCGDIAYVSSDGLWVINISNPRNPFETAFLPTENWTWGLDVAGDFLFLSSENNTMHIMNITDPYNPSFIVNYTALDSVYDVTISGDYAYLATYQAGLEIVNITNVTNPIHVSQCPTPGFGWRVSVEGRYAFMCCEIEGLQIINITDLSNPNIVGEFKYGLDRAYGLDIKGDIAYVAACGVWVVNISNLESPTYIDDIYHESNAVDIYISGDYAYVAALSYGIYILRKSFVHCLDYDQDGLNGLIEKHTYNSNPLNNDTDNDGLTDGVEVNIYGTNPIKNDTDDDFMPDKWEITYSFNPLNFTDGDDDADADFLLNKYEYLNGTYPNNTDCDGDGLLDGIEVNSYHSNPLLTDSDGDSLPDNWEAQWNTNINLPDAGADYDNDGLLNFQEMAIGTAPQNPDTDSDGYNDGVEVDAGTDPLDPNSHPLELWFIVLIIIIIVVGAVATVTTLKATGVIGGKGLKINLLISHKSDDFKPYRIKELSQYLEDKKEIGDALYYERDLVGDIGAWMGDTIPQMPLLLLIATKKSLYESEDCKFEISVAKKNDVELLPIKGIYLTWNEMSDILNLKRQRGIPFSNPARFKDSKTTNKEEIEKIDFDGLCNEVYEYIKIFKKELDAVQKELKKYPITNMDSIVVNTKLGQDKILRYSKILIRMNKIEGIWTQNNTFLKKDEVLKLGTTLIETGKASNIDEIITFAEIHPDFIEIAKKMIEVDKILTKLPQKILPKTKPEYKEIVPKPPVKLPKPEKELIPMTSTEVIQPPKPVMPPPTIPSEPEKPPISPQIEETFIQCNFCKKNVPLSDIPSFKKDGFAKCPFCGLLVFQE